jgi:hypothetical protein
MPAITRATGRSKATKFKKNQTSQLKKSRQQSNTVSSNAGTPGMQKSKKKKKKQRAAPAEADDTDRWEEGAWEDDTNLESARAAEFTDEEIRLSLELGSLIRAQFGKITPVTVAKCVRAGLLGTPKPVGNGAFPAVPPGLGLPTPPEERDDDCELVRRPEFERVLMAVLQHLVVQHLSSFKPKPIKFASPQRVYAVATISMKAPRCVVGARTLRDLVAIIKLLATHAADLFETTKEQDKSARLMSDVLSGTIDHLDAALESLGGSEALLDTCTSDVVNDIRTTPADSLDILEIIQSRVGVVLSLYSRGHQKQIVRSALTGTVQSPAAPAAYQHHQYAQFSTPGHQQMQSQAPPPSTPGPHSNVNLTNGRVMLRGLGVVGRYPLSKDSCALCGKGTAPGAIGHRAVECQASPEEKNMWRDLGIWVI